MVVKIVRHMREDLRGCWRKLHTEEFLGLYSSKNIVRMFI
jgi:hypothetical protein